jgi:3-methyladenine DNA glycosylase AlkD
MARRKTPAIDTQVGLSTALDARVAQQRLRSLGCPEQAAILARFFKTGPGQYGEGDQFIGVKVPVIRNVGKAFQRLPLSEVECLLHSEIHEERLLALVILVGQFHKSDDAARKQIYDLYLANTQEINNWDLVDVSAPKIVGGYLEQRSRRPLYRLAKSACLWERRIAILATFHFINQGDFTDTLKIAEVLLGDKADLIHKAVGWMLREVGKRDVAVLEAFLNDHCRAMPRTMLRYAIERFPEKLRRKYMDGKV